MKSLNLKSIFSNALILVLFAGLTLIYFYPLLKGKDIKQSDITVVQGMSQELKKFKEETGETSMWTNSMFSGMPAYQIMGSQDNNIFYHLVRALRFGLPYYSVAILFSCMLGFFFLLHTMGFNRWLALVGGIAYAFNTFNIMSIEAGHVTKCFAIAFLPTVFAGALMINRGKYLAGFAITALAMGIEVCYNHIQITYYLFLAIGIMYFFYLVDAFKNKTLPDFFKKAGLFAAACGLAILPNITNLWTTYEYGKVTLRSQSELTPKAGEKLSDGLDMDYAFMWSFGKAEVGTWFIPNFMGGSGNEALDKDSKVYAELINMGVPPGSAQESVKNMPMYWGDQPFTSGPEYIGAVVVFLFFFGLFFVKGKEKWWLLTATILAMILSWGRHFHAFNDLMFYYFPLYNKFRAVKMAFVIAAFTMPFLGFFAIKQLLDKVSSKEDALKALKYATITIGGFALLFALMPSLFFNFTKDSDESLKQYGFTDILIAAMRADRADMLSADAWRSFAFVLASAGLIWALITEKVKKEYFFIALGVLILVDLVPVGKRYLTKEDFVAKKEVQNPYTPSAADLQILKDTSLDYRVFNVTVSPFNDASTSYYHKSIGGYHGAKLRRYQDLWDTHISKNNMNVINMLNTRYFIVNGPDKQPMAQQNTEACGNVWFVVNYKLVNTPDEELNSMDSTFNPLKTAIVNKADEAYLKNLNNTKALDSLSQNRIFLASYKPNHLTYESNSISDKLAVFSEIYYAKGWNAYLDGKEVPHIRANYVLRSMVVPAGKHKIEFKFEPQSFYTGSKISLFSSFGIAIILIFALVKNFKTEESK